MTLRCFCVSSLSQLSALAGKKSEITSSSGAASVRVRHTCDAVTTGRVPAARMLLMCTSSANVSVLFVMIFAGVIARLARTTPSINGRPEPAILALLCHQQMIICVYAEYKFPRLVNPLFTCKKNKRLMTLILSLTTRYWRPARLSSVCLCPPVSVTSLNRF